MGEPYAQALERLHFPAAAVTLSSVLVMAMLSLMNSGTLVTSRMIYAAADRGELPESLTKTTRRAFHLAPS